ncbi:P-type conjugative transfer protein TrbG [Burkholderia vietnamiensis]|uniref:P-type conjugative transfer protein TrbG n=1 Tax=Burkholderia vietnamiensis TaxID=60552 RepID=UPI001ABB0DBF|nr:P-type conjugative transfer protein TrbG [Burkholderia vietnamiensis]
MTTRKMLTRTLFSIAAAAAATFSHAAYAIAPVTIDFSGDALAAIKALQAIDPSLNVLPPVGRPIPVPVQVNVKNGNVQDVLRTMGAQGGSMLDIVYSSEGNAVRFIYHAPATPPMQTIPESAIRTAKPDVKRDIVVEDDGMVRFPFGYGNPTVTCAVLSACDISMEPGETVKDAKVGDSARWIVGRADSGAGSTAITHVVVKPKQPNLHTDLKVYTDRRTYTVLLQSSEKNYMPSVGFYYPQESAVVWGKRVDADAAAQQRDDERTIAHMPNVRPDQLDLSYTIKGDRRLPWFPIRAFDDGSHVYIEMPAAMNSDEAPVLLISNGKDMQMVNYRVKPARAPEGHAFYMVDKLFQHAVMVLGNDKDQIKVDIYKGKPSGFFSWAGSGSN